MLICTVVSLDICIFNTFLQRHEKMIYYYCSYPEKINRSVIVTHLLSVKLQLITSFICDKILYNC